MSYTSYNRLRAGIESPTHTISAPVAPQAVDLRMFQGKKRGAGPAMPGNGPTGAGLAGAAVGDVLGAAQQQIKQNRAKRQAKLKAQHDGMEQSRQAHQQSTLDSLTDQANRTAAEPAARMGHQTPDGRVAMSTRDTRGMADGPLGSFGEPAGSPFGVTPSTLDTIGGAFSGAGF
jgi:hypothetical protein